MRQENEGREEPEDGDEEDDVVDANDGIKDDDDDEETVEDAETKEDGEVVEDDEVVEEDETEEDETEEDEIDEDDENDSDTGNTPPARPTHLRLSLNVNTLVKPNKREKWNKKQYDDATRSASTFVSQIKRRLNRDQLPLRSSRDSHLGEIHNNGNVERATLIVEDMKRANLGMKMQHEELKRTVEVHCGFRGELSDAQVTGIVAKLFRDGDLTEGASWVKKYFGEAQRKSAKYFENVSKRQCSGATHR